MGQDGRHRGKIMKEIDLVIFDMAGTTILDAGQVLMPSGRFCTPRDRGHG